MAHASPVPLPMAHASPEFEPMWSPFDDMKLRLKKHGDIACGAIGGPLVVGVLTPQRNAMTLAAKDSLSSFAGLYRQVFRDGFLGGFRGGSRPFVAAVPQFTAIGPVFHVMQRHTNNTGASMVGASVIESLLTFSAQKRNAQIQYNASRKCASEHLAYKPLHHVIAPGFMWHVWRNVFAMLGIRMISPYSHQLVCSVPGSSHVNAECKLVFADFLSSVIAATTSMPMNHLFSWSACTPELDSMSLGKRTRYALQWLIGTYQQQGMRLLSRDLLIRINYTGFLFTGYNYVERNLTAFASSD